MFTNQMVRIGSGTVETPHRAPAAVAMLAPADTPIINLRLGVQRRVDDADRVHTETWRLVRGSQPLSRQCLSIPLCGVSCYVETNGNHASEMCGSDVVLIFSFLLRLEQI